MFIYTAKLNKKIIFIVLALLVLVVCVILLLISRSSGEVSQVFALSSIVKTNDDRVSYLASLGWEVDEQPVDEQEILIPDDFSGVYEEYNQLQTAQGFDLRDFCGFDATRYTYTVLNYPTGEEGVVADLIVYRDEVIAGDVQSTALDGFMAGLEYPAENE